MSSVFERFPGDSNRHADPDVRRWAADDIAQQTRPFVEGDERNCVRLFFTHGGWFVFDRDGIDRAGTRRGAPLQRGALAARTERPGELHWARARRAPLQ